MFSLTKFFAGQLYCSTKVFSVPGRAQQTSQLQEINYSSDWVVWLLFLRAMPSFLHINYESAFGFLFRKPDTLGVNLGTIAYATQKKSLTYKSFRKNCLPGNWVEVQMHFFLMLEDEMKKYFLSPSPPSKKEFYYYIAAVSSSLVLQLDKQVTERTPKQQWVEAGKWVIKIWIKGVWEQNFGFSWEESKNSFLAAGLLNE